MFFGTLISPTRFAASISAAVLTISLAACGGDTTDSATDSAGSSDQVAFSQSVAITGAGASFPFPIYQRWFSDLNQKEPNLQVDYQSVGSGAGVKQFTAETVDFGASDVAMTDEEIAKVERGVLMLPAVIGSM
ncbi:MAG: phosphate ABC transporter substrate-binding protein PstS, partial [Merismopedia sp. SIO2A8]|nr:phosphate ABC transporter substrate-binding protein PstS [Merismopedia sp. SIO2A8]